MSKRVAVCFFLFLLAFFSVIVFRGIKTQGILYHDVGTYLLEAKFLDEGFHVLKSGVQEGSASEANWDAIKRDTTGTPMRMGKPALSALLWLGSCLSGFSDALAAQVTAVCSVLVLGLTFLLALRMGNGISAVFSTALLASSTFHWLYARSGLADPLVTVFFLSAIAVYLGAERRKVSVLYYAVGFLLGMTFCANQWRSAYMPGLLVFLEGIRTWRERSGWKSCLQRMALICFGFLTPLILFQMPYTIARAITGSLPFPDYWGQLADKYTSAQQLTWFEDMGALARSFWKVEGPLFSTLVVAGNIFLLIRLLRKRRFHDLLLLFFSLVPFVYFSSLKMCGETLPRTIASIIPIACIGAGEAFASGFERIGQALNLRPIWRNAVGIVFAVLLMGLMLPRAAKTGITQSGYPEASRYLNAKGIKSLFILGVEPIWRFYLGKAAHEPYARPSTLKDLITLGHAKDIDLVLVDFSTIHSKYGMKYTADLVKHQKPLAVFFNPLGRSLPHLLDLYGIEGAPRIAADETCDKIYIFSIKDISSAST